MTWTREHDRILAERIEGLKVRRWDELPIAQQHYDYCPEELFIGDSIHDKMAHYNLDPAACLRAAEAWRLQKPGRSYEFRSAVDDSFGYRPASAACFSGPAQIAGTGEHLHEALYEAVKDE